MSFTDFSSALNTIIPQQLIMNLDLLGLTTSLGEPQAICPNPTVEAAEGENVDLRCYLDPPGSVVDYAVDWKRRDLNKVVYSYRNKQENSQAQMDQYRGRATLNHEDLRGGILTLQLSSVQLADSGPYRCFVSKLMTSCYVTLNIVTKDQQNRTKRDDSSTTSPPLNELNNPDGGNMTLVIAVLASTAAVIIIIICVLVLKRNSCKALMCDSSPI
ncbi:butyrophilin subfamily 2 member A2-like [Chaetodon trifascialis]|uniref:butyrophilin subfamily 2 member A2-like n=1 Tax=Chaetodon trifascialis TaxID=109706 RepID=UPI0039926527